MSFTLGNFDFHFHCGDMANFVLYREAIHLQCLLRVWAWSTGRPLPNMLKLHRMAQQCVSHTFNTFYNV